MSVDSQMSLINLNLWQIYLVKQRNFEILAKLCYGLLKISALSLEEAEEQPVLPKSMNGTGAWKSFILSTVPILALAFSSEIQHPAESYKTCYFFAFIMAARYSQHLGILGQVGKMEMEGMNLKEQPQSIAWVGDWLEKPSS